MVTETGELAEAMEIARRHYAGLDGARLIVALAVERAEELRERDDAERRALEELIGSSSYPGGYLEELREEWPE
ncbi:hypothetical protein GCM10010921_28970 [Microbacterium album]|uniref:Uncharacterized protein n=2 Tax=Microbacterium album TaxID=2053191 RepID=A0A917IHX8_9MICO|nr:hypothetical protein GCM10010921_28970 [Microbacterium album]